MPSGRSSIVRAGAVFFPLSKTQMTCVPTSLLRSLRAELSRLGVRDLASLQRLVRDRSSSVDFSALTINGVTPTQKHAAEFREHLSAFCVARNGQNVSAFDPLLAFMAVVTRTRLLHCWKYAGVDLTIEYRPTVVQANSRVARLYSNKTHMNA